MSTRRRPAAQSESSEGPSDWLRLFKWALSRRSGPGRGSDDDLRLLELSIMLSPGAAPLIRGTGGLRKMRFAPPSWHTGKRGALRVCYVFFAEYSIVLLANEREDLTADERKEFAVTINEIEGFLQGQPRESGRRRPRSKDNGAGMRKVKARRRKNSVGAEMLNGLREFRDSLSRGERIANRFTVRTVELDRERLLPNEYGPEDVRATRQRLSVSQALFARLLGVSLKLVQSWEQGTRTPEVLARHVLDHINRNPTDWTSRLVTVGKATKGRRRAARVHAFSA